MPGINELLILAVIAAAIFLLPRFFKAKRKARPNTVAERSISGHMRLAIALSIFWIGIATAVFEPWKGDELPFIYFGIAPVIAGWGLRWVLEGFKKN